MTDRAPNSEELSLLLRRAGAAFDPIANVREGDEQRISRCVERALRVHHTTRRPLRRRGPMWLAAALVLVTTSGLAWWSQRAAVNSQVKGPNAGLSAGRIDQKAPKPLRGPVGTMVGPMDTAPVPEPVPPAKTPPKNAPQPPTATELLSRANLARAKGQVNEAIQLYAELQRNYPGSAEAKLSSVSLGRLQLSRGQATGALREFDRYLRLGGPLSEEALAGKAQALGVLGQLDAQRTTYAELLERFPRSVYATEARRQMARGTEER